MQSWKEEFAKHPIHSVLAQLQGHAETHLDEIRPAYVAERARFSKVVKLMQRTLAGIDADVAPLDTINQLLNALRSHGVVDTMVAYSQTANSALFQQANTQINPSISYIYQLSNLKSSKTTQEVDTDVATANLEAFTNAMAQEYDKVTRTAATGVEKVERSIAEVLVSLERARNLETSLQAALIEFEKKTSDSRNQQASEFSTAQDKNRTEFSVLMNDLRVTGEKQSRSVFDDLKTEIDQKKNTTDDALKSVLEAAREKYSSILELYKLTAKDSVSGGYQTIADREYRSARDWRRVTIGAAIIALLWVSVSYFLFTPGDEPDRVFWTKLAKSASITALLISIAVYASRQSTLHRLNERRTRTFSLQVQAFDPFIASLRTEKQEVLKEEMSRRIFGSDDTELPRNTDFESLDKATLLSQIAPLLTPKK